MTTLGAALYFGFFAVAALWLLLTADRPVDSGPSDEHPAEPRSDRTLVGSGRC